VTAQQVAVKKYVVKLSEEEREQLNTLIRTGKHRARQLMKARILLKADVSEAGEGWSDSQIASALDTTVNTVARTRQRLEEQGFEAAVTHQHSPASADRASSTEWPRPSCLRWPVPNRPKACPKRRLGGCARWTLKLLETAVVELNIVERASDNTIGRTLKKTLSSRTCKNNGSFRRMPMRRS
jgi:transposase